MGTVNQYCEVLNYLLTKNELLLPRYYVVLDWYELSDYFNEN